MYKGQKKDKRRYTNMCELVCSRGKKTTDGLFAPRGGSTRDRLALLLRLFYTQGYY